MESFEKSDRHVAVDETKKKLPTMAQSQPAGIDNLQKTLDQLIEDLSSLEYLRDFVSTMAEENSKKDNTFKKDFLNYFESFHKKADEILEQLKGEVKYTETLRDRIEKLKAEQVASELQEELAEERSKITLFISNLETTIKNNIESNSVSINNIAEKTTSLIATDEKITGTLDNLKKEVSEIIKTEVQNAETQFNDMKSDLSEFSTSEIKAISAKLIQDLTEIKDKCIKFIEETQKQNTDLIKAIPAQKDTKKDFMIYGLVVLCFAMFVIQLLFI